jgi:hypothetical protein
MTKPKLKLPSTATGRRRLLKLADLLEADARKKRGISFNLNTVGTTIMWLDSRKPIALDCGTEACAMGLAAISGAFKRQGLSYKIIGRFIETTLNGRVQGYDKSAMDVFNLSMQEADFLFTPCSYPQEIRLGAPAERYVAKRIRDFVAGKAAPT